jgi:hypothetical protein
VDDTAADNTTEPAEQDLPIEPVIDRISDRFPDVDRSRIESLVEEDAAALENAPVKDFIPVLVEHQVMDTLREEADPVPIDEIALADRLTNEPAAEESVESTPEPDPYEVEAEGRASGFYGEAEETGR